MLRRNVVPAVTGTTSFLSAARAIYHRARCADKREIPTH